MKLRTLSLIVTLIAATPLHGQEKTEAAPGTDEATQRWLDAASPNENHRKLAMFAGTWDTRSAFWLEGGEKPPVESKGEAVFSWALGERFLRQEFKGEFMGQPMTGIGYLGYDNFRKAYSQFWMDNTSTAMYIAQGNFDSSGTVLTLEGTMDEPATGETDKPVRYVLRILDQYRWLYELHDLSLPAPNTKVGEILYTKRLEWH